MATIFGQSRKKCITGSLNLHTRAACAINDASFLVATHTWTGWAFDNILTSMHASEAFSTTNKNHMHTKDGAWEGRKLVTRSFGLSDETCVLQACTSPPKTCYIQPALTFYCKYYCGPCRKKFKKIKPLLQCPIMKDTNSNTHFPSSNYSFLNMVELKKKRYL